MKKRYSSPSVRFTVNIKVDGKPMRINFIDYDREEKRRYIIIDDPVIQEKLEASMDFGSFFRLDDQYHDISEPTKPIVTEPEQEAKEAESLAEAKRFLSELGVRVYPSMNKTKAIEAAKEIGIALTIKN